MVAESRFVEVFGKYNIILTDWLDFTKTTIPLALMDSDSIPHSVLGLVDSEPIRAQGIIVN